MKFLKTDTLIHHFEINECHFKQVDGIMAEATIKHSGKEVIIDALGNGRLDAVSNTIKQYFDISYELTNYEEHALSTGSSSKAMSYVGITYNGQVFWGVGIDEDIIKSSIIALVVAVNKIPEIASNNAIQDDRYIAMINYIQANYQTITLEEMSNHFKLTSPYISKFIKEKSGKTFKETLQGIRLKKARTLLKNGNMTVENIAYAIGYQNVENFNRLFKKVYNMTPLQFRNSKDLK